MESLAASGGGLADTVLSGGHQSPSGKELSVYTDLQSVCPAGDCPLWSLEGRLEIAPANLALPSVWWQWLRSRRLNDDRVLSVHVKALEQAEIQGLAEWEQRHPFR